MLTTGTDIVEGTGFADTINGTSATLQAADIIVGGEGPDTLNLTINSAGGAAATVSGVETVNVESTLLVGGVVYDATNTKSAAINLSVNRFGSDGVVEVTALGANTLTAGSGVSAVTATDATTTTITTGSATSLTFDDTAATNETFTVAATSALTSLAAATSQATDTVVVTGGATINVANSVFAAGSTLTAAGATIKSAGDVLGGSKLTAAVAEVDDTAANVANWTVDSIAVTGTAGATLTNVANGQNVTVLAAQAGGAVSLAGKAGAESVTVNTNVDLVDLTTTVFTTTNLVVGADVDVTGTLDALDSASISGSGNVTVDTLATLTFLDASGLTGDLTITNIGATSAVVGATGATTYTTITGTNTFQGQGGNDKVTTGILAANATFTSSFGAGNDSLTLDAGSNAASTVIADLGAGNDSVVFGLAPVGTYNLTGGDGTDAVVVVDGTDLTGVTGLTLTGFEAIQIAEAAGLNATAASILAEDVNGQAFNVSITNRVDDTLTLTVDALGSTSVDLSKLTFVAAQLTADAVEISIDGNDTAVTVVGSAANDTITSLGAAKSITTGGGSDVVTLVAGDSGAMDIVAIQDFTIAATGDFDSLDLDADATLVADVVGGDAKADFADVFGTAVNAVTYDITDGIISFTGTTADLALLDTVAEAISIAEIAATAVAGTADSIGIEFGGSTYIVETDAADAIANVVQLVGVVGVDALAGAQAANTVVLA